MTIAQPKKKVKKKKRVNRKKRQVHLVSNTRSKKKKTAKKKKKESVASLKKQVAALKKKLAAKKKAQAAKVPKKKPEPGDILSPRSEAARKGWTTRRANKQKKALDKLHTRYIKELAVDDETAAFISQPHVQKQINNDIVDKLNQYGIDPEKWITRPDPVIMAKLIVAKAVGNFDETAKQLAEEYGYEANEIYSLWWGYALPE